jgi:hypothetical protein
MARTSVPAPAAEDVLLAEEADVDRRIDEARLRHPHPDPEDP